MQRLDTLVDRALRNHGLADAADRAMTAGIERGAVLYRRGQHLPPLIHTGDIDLDDRSPATSAEIVSRLQTALNRNVNLLRNGHWAADVNRTMAIRSALAAEGVLRGASVEPQPEGL